MNMQKEGEEMTRFKSKIVGIDLGTTNTIVSYFDEIAKRGECCMTKEGGKLTPSAVFFETPASYLVGRDARDAAIVYPDQVALYFKRLMGKTKEAINIEGITYSPQQLSALILKKVVEDAELELEEEIRDVVITVPAYFNSAAKQATKEAGIMAGLNVRDIIDEPCAALFHIDCMDGLSGKKVGIFDLGGGTLDLIAAEIKDREIDEIVIRGNTNLGGCDWNKMLKKYIRDKYLHGKKMRIDDEQEFENDIEKVKIALTRKIESRLVVRDDTVKIPVKITRSEFEICTKPLLDKVREVVQAFLNELKDEGIEYLDKIIMVGGASRMPQIDKMIRELFPNSEIIQKDCDEAVAKGAAVYAKMLCDGEKEFNIRKKFELKKLNRVSARSYGVAALIGDSGDKKICNMLFKNMRLPMSVTKRFFTSIADQKTVNILVYETTTTEKIVDIRDEHLLGKCVLNIEEKIPRKSEIMVDFHLKEDGILTVEGREPRGKTSVRAVMESGALLNSDELELQAEEVNGMELID